MTRDPIFQTLPAELLPQLSKTLGFDPVVVQTSAPSRLLSALPESEQIRWLGTHRYELEDHLSFVGSSFLSYVVGNGKSYREIVIEIAAKLNVGCRTQDSTTDIEQSIIRKVWNDTVARMTPEQRQELLAQTEALAAKYGVGIGKEMAGFATLTVAQMSGFGVYLLGSTLLGAINGALGLGLGFGAFTGLSSIISTVIGPVGWAALGLFTILKLGRPNYKKLLPAIILIATARVAQDPGLLPAPAPQKEPKKQQSALQDKQVVAQRNTSPIQTSLAIYELQTEVAKAATRTRSRCRHRAQSGPVQIRRASKQEKTVFDLKHKALANYARNLQGEVHYLDLSPEDRALVDELFRQYEADEKETTEEQQRNERLRAENQKRENRLRNKGKIKQLDEVRRRNFENEFPELSRVAGEFDHTRHYLELTPAEQQFVREYVNEERTESAWDQLTSKRLSDFEQAFATASAKDRERHVSVPPSDAQRKTPDRRVFEQNHPRAGGGTEVVNLETGHPTVEQARKLFSEHIQSSKKTGISVLKLIHGYGSTGNGGAIRNGIRRSLQHRRREGSVRVVVHGENWSIFGEDSRHLIEACPDLKADRDLDRSNPGITFVLL